MDDQPPKISDGYRIVSVKKGETDLDELSFAIGDLVRVIGGYAGGEIIQLDERLGTARIKRPDGMVITASLDLLILRGSDPAKLK